MRSEEKPAGHLIEFIDGNFTETLIHGRRKKEVDKMDTDGVRRVDIGGKGDISVEGAAFRNEIKCRT